jgi:hypothetical protein
LRVLCVGITRSAAQGNATQPAPTDEAVLVVRPLL